MRTHSLHSQLDHPGSTRQNSRSNQPFGRIASRSFIAMLLLVGLVLILQGLWIKGKTVLGDSLLNQAVERSLDQGSVITPDLVPRSPDLG